MSSMTFCTQQEYSDEYLQSSHWQEVKALVYATRKHCQLCWFGTPLNIYHITYNRLVQEDLRDLIVLCERCHSQHDHVGFVSSFELFTITGGAAWYPRTHKTPRTGVIFWA